MTKLSVIRGDDEVLNLTVTDPEALGAPVDLTGATLTFMVKRRPDDLDAAALITKTSPAGGITIANQSTNKGKASVAIAATNTANGPTGLFFWELQSLDGASLKKTFASGRFDIVPDLVRA